jgi:ribose 5-phosphate isomerase B
MGSDHAGVELKSTLKQWLKEQGYQIHDHGTYAEDSVDYPDYVHPVAGALAHNPDAVGLVICGSGNGVCMTANKYNHVRAALAWAPELARLGREHNNANVLCLPARFIEADQAQEAVMTFLTTEFAGGRHNRRVAKIAPQREEA